MRTRSSGRDRVLVAPEEAHQEVRGQVAPPRTAAPGDRSVYDVIWSAALRKAERASPGFDV